MRTMCSREIFTKKSRQQQNFDSDLKGAWHYNHVTFTPIAKIFLLYCRLFYVLSILCVTLTIKVKVGISESFKVGWYRQKITESSHLKRIVPANTMLLLYNSFVLSHFEYCNSSLMGIGKTLNKKLEDANYYGLRTIMNMGKSTDYESILRTADMNTLEHFINVSRRMVQAM